MLNIENSKTLKYHTFSLILYIIYSKCGNKDEKIFKEKELIEILKMFGLIKNI